MNFLTQIGVLAIILIILLILIKSNQTLEKIYMEEEQDSGIARELPKFNLSSLNLSQKRKGKVKRVQKKEDTAKEKTFSKEKRVERASGTVPVDTSSKWSVELLSDRGSTIANYRITAFPYSIGRSADNDLVLDDLSVSGYHAMVEECDGRVTLEDQGSLNKMMVNGTCVTEIEITDQMEVDLGNTRLRFHREGKAAAPTICFNSNTLMEEWY